MADYQRVIEFLRDVRQGAGSGGLQTVNEEIAQMAADYADLCAKANDRLRTCSGFLQQGLRTEAIHLAEESPNLLDLIAQLDLPDPQSWAEFCQNNGYPVPPALQLDRAAQLNEAYSQDQPLEHLMARHRLLALSRAPVRERLDVMRKIAGIDANGGGGSHWEKDLRVFEQARLKELPSAFYNAVKNHDTHAIAGLMDELNGQTWYESPPAELLSAVGDAHARVVRLGVEAELRKLVEPLREAYAARSLQECQALVQRWKNAMANAGVTSVAGELMDEIRPVVAFIAEQTRRDDFMKRFHESCKTFARMLDADASDAQLEAGYAKLKEFKEEIPEELTRRYTNKRTGRRKDVDRRHKLRLAAIAGSCAIVLILLGVGGWLLLRENPADKWAGEINAGIRLHTRDGLMAAQNRVDDLQKNNPALLKEPAVSTACNDLQVAQQKYGTDAASVAADAVKIEKSRQAADQVIKRPDATMDEIRASAGDLEASINEASELLKTADWADPDDKLKTAVAGAQAIRHTMQDRVLETVTAQLKSIKSDLDAVPDSTSTPQAAMQAQNQLSALADRMDRLKGLPLLDQATSDNIKSLAGAIARRRDAADVTGGIADALQNIRNMTATTADIRTALTSFINRFPADPRTADFKTALDRLAAGEALEAWQEKIAGYEGKFAPTSLADAQKRLDDITAFLAAHPEFPKAADAQAYCDYLKHAVDAMGENGAWQAAFDPLVNATKGVTLLTDLGYMQVSDGRRLYTLGDPKRVEHKMNAQVSVTFDTLDLKPDAGGKVDYTKTVPVTIDPPLTVSDAPLPAPHTKVVGDIRDGLKTINADNWDTFGIDLADRLARNDAMDIVVKAILLETALKTQTTVTGSLLGDAYDRTIDALGRQKPDELPWPDPTKISDGTRKSIKTIVDQMPPATAMRQKLATAKAILFKSMAVDLLGSGVLLKDDAGTWTVNSRTTPINGMMVWAVVPATIVPATGATAAATAATGTAPAIAGPPPDAMNLQMIGTAAAGKFVLDAASLRDLPQGNIIFITRN